MVGRTLALAFALVLALGANGMALAAQSPPGQGIHLIAGGGRFWEGTSTHPTAVIDITGTAFKVGPGNEPADYVCHWTVRLVDVAGTDFDGAVFRGSQCRDVTVWAAGAEGGPEAAMRLSTIGTLDGSPGYAIVMHVVDVAEPGALDTIRVELYHGTVSPVDPVDRLYDSRTEFHRDAGQRTFLDAGNFQSWVDAPIQ
jgi:hypothetical protein